MSGRNNHTSPFDDKYQFSSDNLNSSSQGTSTDSPYITDGGGKREFSYNKDNSSTSAESIEFSPAIKHTETFASVNLKDAHVTFGSEAPHRHNNSKDNEEDEEEDALGDLPVRRETVFKRHRWGTQRRKDGKPVIKRNKTFKRSLSKRFPNSRVFSSNNEQPLMEDEDFQPDGDKDRSREKRSVYWNLPLPESQLTEDGQPPHYPRNKIRTTKYTPLSFIPKNLYYQFENVANIYFLIMIILGAFTIFGVPNPVLSAVPLIVIVIITAFKDALEDSRRTATDLEVNNQVTHVLKGIDNPNFSGEKISLWRRFKKLNSRLVLTLIRTIRGDSVVDPLAEDKVNPRKSIDSFDFRTSIEIEANQDVIGSNLSLNTASANPFSDSNELISPYKDKFAIKMKPFTAPPSGSARYADLHPTFKKDYWKNVHVGDILKLKNNDQIPVDVIILASSDSDGACYVETKNLDGETNLKVKQSMKCSSASIKTVNDLSRCKFWLESEGPKANLYSYQGNLNYYANGDEKDEVCNEAVTINNMLLRGCSLRNTKWVVGIVAFTGDDTKIMLNAGVTPSKRSRIARELNVSVILNFILLFVLCFVSGLVNGIYYGNDGTSRDAYEFGTIAGSAVLNGIVSFFVAVILYQSLVPISLYISIEIIKTAQAYFIYSDVKMWYEKLDYPCVPKSWNISDDLGQIEYIFSDKTGTLTQNVMEYKKCTINGISYGRAYTEAYADIRRRQGIDVEEEATRERKEIQEDKVEMIKLLKEVNVGEVSNDISDEITFISKSFAQDLNGKSGESQKFACENFILALALCHSVLTEKSEKDPTKLELKAQSPDEAALVATARDVGFEFLSRTKKGVILNVQGIEKEYQVLNILEFNSTRKRMSAIIKIPSANRDGEPTALLICKGADSIIYSRLSDENNQELLEKTALDLEQYASEGLRTLCIAQRELPWSEYLNWQKRHDIASASLEDREGKMEDVASSIERNLTLLGGTAIEDRLQDGVPESIQLLAKAGIKLWVLTGDKVETAINIGFSCNLLQNGMNLLIIKTSGEDIEEIIGKEKWNTIKDDKVSVVSMLIEKYMLDHFGLTGSLDELHKAKADHSPPHGNFGIVIDGDALKVALNDKIKINFLLLCKQCKAVLCCRVSPAQKAAVVTLVKDTLDVMTLAIGDGSNDVAMIQAADVGVGIAGEEGTQAVMSADYAIGQFRYLARLVLVHGRWSYKRLAEMIPSFFYKNVVFTLALFWYGIYDNFDGTYLFEYTYLMFYNLAFTSLPVIFLGIFDQDIDAHISLIVPQLYRSGILRQEWTMEKFGYYMLDGFYQSIMAYFYPYFLYMENGIVTENGLALDHRYLVGALVATICIVSCNIYVLIHQYRWDWLSLLIIFLSIIIVWGWTGIWSSSYTSADFYKAAVQLYGSASWWACFFVGFLVCMLPRFTYDAYQKLYDPADIDIIRECVARGDFDHYPTDYDPTDPNRPKVSKYTKDLTLEANRSHPGYKDDPNSPQPYRDSINGTGGKKPTMLQRMFGKRSSTGTELASNSVDTLATEEIEMEYTQANRRNDGTVGRPSFQIKATPTDGDRLSSLRNNIQNNRRSLENTRARLSTENERPSLDRVRASLDLPELTTAESLIGRLSFENKNPK